MKLVFVGDTCVGKTSLIVTYVNEEFPDIRAPTVSDTFTAKRSHKGHEISLQIFDTAGSNDLAQMRIISYSGTDAFLVCFSLVDRTSFDHAVSSWVSELRATARLVPVILVGTKQDLRDEYMVSGREAECISDQEAMQAV